MDRSGWDERHAAREYDPEVAPNQFVQAHLSQLTPGRAIDLAAGECRHAVWLAARGWHVIAVDYSRVGLDRGRRLAADHDLGEAIDFVLTDALSYAPPEPVDLVVIAYLQLPSREQGLVLRRAATWLRPGGTLFVVAHDRSNVERGHGGPSSPGHCYDLDATVSALAGLEVTTAEIVEREVETDDGVRIALDTLVVATRAAG